MKNKIHNYNFLVVGAGLIGSLAALHLLKKGYSVLVLDKNLNTFSDNRTLAVNANSKDFLINLGLWEKLKSKPQNIDKIIIKDNINNSPLVLENKHEEMGNVIFNTELLSVSRDELLSKKILFEQKNLSISKLCPKKIIILNNHKYKFENIILSLGKKFSDNSIIKKYTLPTPHNSFVGFFNHTLGHNQTAYEIFTSDGPLAVLPSPQRLQKCSTFIYSTKNNLSKKDILKLLKYNFSKTHGNITLDKNLYKYDLLPHLSKDKYKKYFLIGDTLRSIHPVAGQGWNLGIKDIQHLSKVFDQHNPLDPQIIHKYYSQRTIENFSYLSFTSIINLLYENQNSLSKVLIKSAFKTFQNSELLRNIFIRQAMGRLNLI